MIKLSVIIPSRNEFPHVVFTAYSILHCLEAEGFFPDDVEIIIVNNCSSDTRYPQRGTGGTTDYLLGRSAYYNRVIRMVYDPIAGNHSARNKGALVARGRYLFFTDAHMAYRPGYFSSIISAFERSGAGIVHGAVNWMGAYPPDPQSTGYGYTLKMGEEWKGTWNNYKVADDFFFIPAQGHCSLLVDRAQFLAFGGYPKVHRTYGGGELYLNMKYWMFGSSVAVDPNAMGYHLSAGRGYSYQHDDYLENVLGMTYALSCDDWRERTYINWLRKGKKQVLDGIMRRGEAEYATDRIFVSKYAKFSFNELLVARPWEKRNDALYGRHVDTLLIFHDTWLPLIKGTPAEAAYPGLYQEGLEKFINENLSGFVYGRKPTA